MVLLEVAAIKKPSVKDKVWLEEMIALIPKN